MMHRNEEVARMTHLSRYCTGCSEERLFEQFHAEPASCPDAPEGDCQEWGCTECGEALIIGFPLRDPARSRAASSAALPPDPPDLSCGSVLFLGRSISHD